MAGELADQNERTLESANEVVYDVHKWSRSAMLEYLVGAGRPSLVLVQQLTEGNVGGRRVKIPILVVTTDGAEVFGKELLTKPHKRPEPVFAVARTDFDGAERTGAGKYVALTTTQGETVALRVEDDAVAWRVVEALETLTDATSGPRPQPGVDYGWINAVVLASHGYEFTEAQPVVLGKDAEAVWLRTHSPSIVMRAPFETIMAAEAGGPGEVQTGGGFIGGGFGVDGFLIGAAGAAVLNKLTTRSSVQTVLRITTEQGEITLFTDQAAPDALDNWLAPIRHAIAVRSRNPPPQASAPSVADELMKLAELRDVGVLTEQEFAEAKARLLGK